MADGNKREPTPGWLSAGSRFYPNTTKKNKGKSSQLEAVAPCLKATVGYRMRVYHKINK